jgi:hypothetical protein
MILDVPSHFESRLAEALKDLQLGLGCAITVVLKGDSPNYSKHIRRGREKHFVFTALDVHLEQVNAVQSLFPEQLA